MKFFRHHRFIVLGLFAVLALGFSLSFVHSASAQVIQSASDLGITTSTQQAIGLGAFDLRITIARIIRVALTFLGVVALVLVLYAGFLWMTAGGNEEKIATAKKILVNAVIGLVLILSAYAIVSFVINKLVEATTIGPGNGGGGGGGGGGGYFPQDVLYVQQLPAGGQMCVRNVHPVLVFNNNVSLDAGLQQNIVIEKDDTPGVAVNGVWTYGAQHNVVVFVPQGDCGGGPSDCLEPSTNYTLKFKDTSQVVEEGNSSVSLNCALGAQCNNVSFRSGDGVDRLPPTISIVSPAPNSSVQKGDVVPVKVHWDDDFGVQNVTVSVDSQFVGSKAIQGCVKSGDAIVNWPTVNVPLGGHSVSAIGYDWAGNQGNDANFVNVKPAHCFNGIQDIDETGVDCGGSSCGACGGNSCTNNSQCSSGYCEIPDGKTQGVCVDKMRITDVSPQSGASSTYVSISGDYFGNTAGHVYFASTTNPGDQDWTEATIVPACGLGAPSNWTPWQILVEAPPLSNGLSGPIKVVTAPITGPDNVVRTFTDQTNDNWGPRVPDFQFNNIIHPGLCRAIPNSNVPGGTVSLLGKNLGPYSGNNKIIFGNTNATVSQFDSKANLNWNDGLIREIFVPFLDPSTVGLKIISSQGIESNGVRFLVTAGVSSDAPIISGITPTSGAQGEYITISGKNFGSIPNLVDGVWFRQTPNSPIIKGSFDFPASCGDSFWRDDQIIVKFNKNLGTPGTSYVVQVNNSAGKISSFDPNYSFALQDGLPRPGLCRIDPVSGPIPFAHGQSMQLVGEYFTGSPEIFFWALGASGTTTDGRVGATLGTTSTISGADVANAAPNLGSDTGPVIVHPGGEATDKISNPFQFNRWNCVQNNNTCTQPGYHCCTAGADTGFCKQVGDLCAGQTRDTSYIWRFSTKDIPDLPRVVERCNADSENGLALPSPTPSTLWDVGAHTELQDHHNVCRQALVTVEFSTAMDQTTVVSNNVEVFKCAGGYNGTTCQNPQAVTLASPDSFHLNASFGGIGGGRQFIQMFRDQHQNWDDDSWYQVVLLGGANGIKSAGSVTSSFQLAPDRPCAVANSAYCFTFRTDTSDCKMRKVVITPYSYWTNVLEEPMKYRLYGNEQGPLYYTGNGLSSQRCIMMDVSSYSWYWESSDSSYAEMSPTPTTTTRVTQASALANTVNIGLNNPLDAVNINATASTNSLSYTGHSPLTIDLSKPRVLEEWPNCMAACTNAEIGVRFNITMSNKNVDWTTARLYRCLDENCLVTVASSTPLAKPKFLPPDRVILSIPHDEMMPNSIYKVSLSSSNNPDYQLWSAGRLKDASATSAPFAEDFSWRFKTKATKCLIDHVQVNPSEFKARSLNDRSPYTVQPFSAPDSCSATGQRLDPWKVGWDWSSSDTNVATVQSFSTGWANKYCTASCVKKGSDVPSGVGSAGPVCGNGKVEAGEDCDVPDKNKGCGLDCRFLGNSDPKTCGDGIVEPNLGEACDPKDPATQIGCSANCLHLGSKPASGPNDVSASICGNGFIGSGEDCDLGVTPDISVSTSSLGCSLSCLHLGTRLSAAWCEQEGTNKTYGNFDVNTFNQYCAHPISVCGDGVVTPDKDDDPNNFPCEDIKKYGLGKHAPFCNDYCVHNDVSAPALDQNGVACTSKTEGCNTHLQFSGSSLAYSSPSQCGDGIVGIGEDPFCEDKNYLTPNGHGGIIDPWSLAIGVGKGVANSDNPPAQVAQITAGTNQQTKGGKITGSGNFVIPCGFKSDAECQALVGSNYGVGQDSCCYLRPKLTATFPPDKSQDVCPNTYIEADFSTYINSASLPGNFLLAHGVSGTSNATPTPIYRGFVDSSIDKNAKLAGSISVVTVGSYAYVAAYADQAVNVFDVTKPAQPVFVTSTVNGSGGAVLNYPIALTASGSYLYVVSGGDNQNAKGSFQIFDITNPKVPLVLGSLIDGQVVGNSAPVELNGAYSVTVAGNIAYVVSQRSGALQLVDVSDKKNPKPLAVIDQNKVPGLSQAVGVAVVGNYAYVTASKALTILDVSDPTNPIATSTLFGLASPYGIAANGSFAYVANFGDSSFQIINTVNKGKPFVVSKLVDGQGINLGKAVGVAMADKYVYVTAQGGQAVEIIDVSSSTQPLEIGHIGLDNTKNPKPYLVQPTGIFVKGDYAYVASYGNGGSTGALEMIDVSDFNPLNPNNCTLDVSQYIQKLALVSDFDNLPWYKKVWTKVANFFRNLFGLSVSAANPEPTRWCVGDDLGSLSVIGASTSSPSKVVATLNHPLITNADYAIIVRENVRDIRGVSVGTSTNSGIKNINVRFVTGNDICRVSSVAVDPATWYFSHVNASTTFQAKASSQTGWLLQSLPGFYSWDYLWGPYDSASIKITQTTSSLNSVSAQNRNGEVDLRASARIADNTYNIPQSGVVATGRSHIIVQLCENPWPPKDLYYNGQGPFTILPYSDSAYNNDNFNLASDTFDNTPLPPSAVVKDGYFNFSSYYCADAGQPGFFDDLPLLRPVVQTSTADLIVADSGTCSESGATCKVDGDCGLKYVYNKTNYFIPIGMTGICGVSTSTQPFERYYTNGDQPLACASVKDCNTPEFGAWATPLNGATKCFVNGVTSNLTCQKFPPLKRFLFTNAKNDDVIGIQVFSNPKHLSPTEWFNNSKKTGGQGFVGPVQHIDDVGGYEAASDGSNFYIGALNYSTSTQNLFSTMYLFSINQDAKPETHHIFDQLLQNLKFNTNLTNFQYCGPSIDQPQFQVACKSDLDCPGWQVCANSVDKMKRDYQRLKDAKTIDSALAGYAAKNNGNYPDLKEGSFLPGQTLSVWPQSWPSLGAAVGTNLPVDPINQLGVAGTCASSTNKFCTGDDPATNILCPIAKGGNAPEHCVLHDPATGWSTENDRFSFACATSSLAYRYITSNGNYQLRLGIEDPGFNPKNGTDFVKNFDYNKPNNIVMGNNQNKNVGICNQDQEITTYVSGVCGDNVINWDKGEQCDPPGQSRYGACGAVNKNQVSVDVCSRPNQVKQGDPGCQWVPSSTPFIDCSKLSTCGNGVIEAGEVCDDGKLNGRYNHCNSDCKGWGGVGYCGNGILENKASGSDQNYESCEITTPGKSGWCAGGLNSGKACNVDNDCRVSGNLSSALGVCAQVNSYKVKYNIDKNQSCNFDCQSTGPYCGDGVVQSEFGEECDGDQTCTVGGKTSVRHCSASCKWTDQGASAWWRFNDYVLDQNTTKAVFRNEVSNLDATCTGGDCPTPTNNAPHNAFAFSQNKVTVPDDVSIMPTSTLSVEVWAYPTSYNTRWQRILEKGGWLVGGGYGLEFNLEGVNPFNPNLHHQRFIIWGADGNTRLPVDSDIDIPLNQWVHIVGTYQWQQSNGLNTASIYINGVLHGTSTMSMANGPIMGVNHAAPLTIGKAGAANQALNFQGNIGEVRIYNRVLTAAEVADHYNNSGVCQVNLAAPQLVAAPGTCGDGVVNPNTEACDNGLGSNGVACTPAYGKSCSYCSADCKHVIDVLPTAYCGDGIIEENEQCDTDQNTGDIFVAVSSTTSTLANIDQQHNGYKELACSDELANQLTFKKGTKACINNCSSIIVKETKPQVSACITCGPDKSGTEVSGSLINALNPTSADPIYDLANDTHGGYLNVFFYNKNNSPVEIPGSYHASASYRIKDGGTGADAPLANNPLCSQGTPSYKATINIDWIGGRVFDFPVFGQTNTWQYDYILSPVISVNGLKHLVNNQDTLIAGSLRPNDIRIVISSVGNESFYGGFIVPNVNGVTQVVEGASIPQTSGPTYFSAANNYGIWYHGANSTPNLLNAESFTINTTANDPNKAMVKNQYAFYVRTAGDPIANFKSNSYLKVDVYVPENTGSQIYYNLFSRPNQTFYFNTAGASANPAATYWHVFNVQADSINPNAPATRIVPVNRILTDFSKLQI